MKKNHANRNWIPIAGETSGINIAVDFDPGPKGVKGQVIYFGVDISTYFQLGTSFDQFCLFLLERYKKREIHRWLLLDGKNEEEEELYPTLCRINNCIE